MREICNSWRTATETQVELKHTVEQDEVLGLHRDRREYQHDHTVWVRQAVRQQDAKDATGRAECRIQATLCTGNDELHDSGANDTGEVIRQESPWPHQAFQVSAKHPQTEHVEKNV